MYPTLDSSKVEGSYKYLRHDESIFLKGTLVGKKLEIEEKGNNRFYGYFDYDTGIVSGTWYSGDANAYYHLKCIIRSEKAILEKSIKHIEKTMEKAERM